ncbi:MAG: DUF4258 domain-containing protein [Candidatus Nanoarchaeia archaeon]|nr:DUF4258 domain-containing protein [Candidatus Nanoarchaeia archaeon]
MEICYTYHAFKRINKRKLIKVWIEETIKSPDLIKRQESKYFIIKKLNGKTLKVVYEKTRYIKVITFYFIK